MALRAAILLYLVPTFLFIINVIYSWGDFALYLGLKQIFIFLAIDILIISCIICLIDTSSTSLTFKTFSSRDINLTVLVGSILICIFIIATIANMFLFYFYDQHYYYFHNYYYYFYYDDFSFFILFTTFFSQKSNPFSK